MKSRSSRNRPSRLSSPSAASASSLSSPSNMFSDTASTTSEGVLSAISVGSSYRHHSAGPFMPQTPTEPKPTLVKDQNHKPKTTGSVGLMICGLGGANGTTMLAGILANRLGMEWRGAKGEKMTPNYNGCITQLNQKGKYGGVGYKDRVRLADATMAAVGGWVSSRTQTSFVQ
jgi:hypothetical protein